MTNTMRPASRRRRRWKGTGPITEARRPGGGSRRRHPAPSPRSGDSAPRAGARADRHRRLRSVRRAQFAHPHARSHFRAEAEGRYIPRHLGRAHRSAKQRFQRAVRSAGKRSRLLYPRGEQATFASAVGRSFYQQLLPSNSVTLGWSSWSGNGFLARLP